MNKMGEENFMSTKVMLVDDHALIREGIKQLLEFDGSIDVIEQASDGAECLEKLQHVLPDILLLDINMPNVNGIEVLEEIKKKNIPVKVLMLTVHSEVEYRPALFQYPISLPSALLSALILRACKAQALTAPRSDRAAAQLTAPNAWLRPQG